MPRDDKAIGWAVAHRAYDFDCAVYALQFLAASAFDAHGAPPRSGQPTAATEHPAGFASCLGIVADALESVHAQIRPSEYLQEPAEYPVAAILERLPEPERAAAIDRALAMLRDAEAETITQAA